MILASNLIVYVYITLRNDELSSPCISESLGCCGDHWLVHSARLLVGGSSCGCVWTRIPMSPGACAGCTSGRAKESRSKGGWRSPSWWESWDCCYKTVEMSSKTRRSWFEACLSRESGIYPWPGEYLESQMSSTCQKQRLKGSADMFYTFFTLFHSNKDYKHSFFRTERWGFWNMNLWQIWWGRCLEHWVWLRSVLASLWARMGQRQQTLQEKTKNSASRTSTLGACFRLHPSISTCLNVSFNWGSETTQNMRSEGGKKLLRLLQPEFWAKC